MKHYLHFVLATLLAASATPALAQKADSPLVVTVGENTAPDGNVYFTFTAPVTGLFHTDLVISSYDKLTEIDEAGDQTVIGKSVDYNKGSDFYVKAGYTYNFSSTVRGEQTFTITVTPTSNALLGDSCDAPMVLDKEGGMLVPCYSPDYGVSTHYFEFTPDIDGKLKLYVGTSFRTMAVAEGCDTGWDSLSYEFDYSSSLGSYIYTLMVDKGQTYIFEAVGSTAVILNCELYEVISGASCEDPFYVKAGEHEIPAEAGTYYYQFTTPSSPTQCAIAISSDAAVSASLYTSCNSYSTSVYESLNIRKAPIYSGNSYILEVTKNAATAAPETFSLAFEDLLPVEDSNVGETVNFDTQYTTPAGGGNTYYYTFELPADSDPMFLSVKSDALPGQYGSNPIRLHERGMSYPSYGDGTNFRAEIKPGVVYMLDVTVPQDAQYTFSMSLEEMQEGMSANYPIAGSAGANTLPAFSPVYLSYCPDASGYLQVSIEDPTASLAVATVNEYGYSQSVALSQVEDGWKFECIAGTGYTFTVNTSGEATVLNIEYAPYGPGESFGTAIPLDMAGVDEMEIALPDGPSKVWYVVEAPITGFFNLTTTMKYAYPGEIVVCVNEESRRSNVASSYYDYIFTPYKGEVSEGDKVYICFNNTQAQEAPTATVYFTEPAPGQAASKPIEIEYETPVTVFTIPTASYDAPIWYGIELPEGLLNICAEQSCTLRLYSADDSSKQLAECGYNYSTGEYRLTDYALPAAGKYLLCLSSNYTDGQTVQLFVNEPEPGQTAGTAIALDMIGGDMTLDLTGGVEKAEWYKFEVNAGDLQIMGMNSSYWSAYIYKESDLLNYAAMTTSYNIDGEYRYGIADFPVDEPRTLYLCINRANDDIVIVFSGSAVEPVKDPDFVTVSIGMTDGQKVAYMAPNHSFTTFGVTAPENWVVESVEIDGESLDVEAAYSVVTENQDITVEVALAYAHEVVFVDETTGVVALDAKVNIAVSDGKVVISNVSVGDNIAVYTVSGLRMAGHVAQDTQVEFELPSGTYIVTVNNNAAKVQL